MALSKQIKTVRFVFWSITADTSISTVNVKVQNYSIEQIHEREGGGALYTKSLDGTIIPYPTKSRKKYSLTFDRSIEPSVMATLFNNFILYNRTQNASGTASYEIRFYADVDGAPSEYDVVWLDKEMQYMINYSNTVGVFLPSISVIGSTLDSEITSAYQAPA